MNTKIQNARQNLLAAGVAMRRGDTTRVLLNVEAVINRLHEAEAEERRRKDQLLFWRVTALVLGFLLVVAACFWPA